MLFLLLLSRERISDSQHQKENKAFHPVVRFSEILAPFSANFTMSHVNKNVREEMLRIMKSVFVRHSEYRWDNEPRENCTARLLKTTFAYAGSVVGGKKSWNRFMLVT